MSAFGRKGGSRSKRDPAARPSAEASSDPPPPFVNVGLDRWTRERDRWTSPPNGYVKPPPPPDLPPDRRPADADDLYSALLTPDYAPLPRRVPLSELIIVLQEVRELST